MIENISSKVDKFAKWVVVVSFGYLIGHILRAVF